MFVPRHRIRRLRSALHTWSRPRFWVPLWVVLALGILNPAACLVHCAPPHAEMHAAYAALHSGAYFGFLCLIPPVTSLAPAVDAPPSSSLQPDPSGLPRAVFPGALVALALLPLLRIGRRNRYLDRLTPTEHEEAPLLPPPRLG